jgi:hypothetical protein
VSQPAASPSTITPTPLQPLAAGSAARRIVPSLTQLLRLVCCIDAMGDDLFKYVDLRQAHSLFTTAWRRLKPFMLRTSRAKTRSAMLTHVSQLTAAGGSRAVVTVNVMDAKPTRRRGALATLQSSVFGQVWRECGRRGLLAAGAERRFLTAPLFQVHMQGFGAHDAGGPYREILSMIGAELGEEHPNGLFHMNPLFTAAEDDCVMPSPDAFEQLPRDTAEQAFHFFGMMIANFAITSDVLPADLPPYVWKVLVEDPVGLQELAGVDSAVHAQLSEPARMLSGMTLNNLEEEFPGFTAFATQQPDVVPPLQSANLGPEATAAAVERVLLPSGVVDGAANIARIADIATALELHERHAPALRAIATGLRSVIPAYVLRGLHWLDLQEMVCGKPQVSVQDFRASSRSSLPAARTEMFFRVLERMTAEERSRVLAFATGQRRFPLKNPIKIDDRSSARPNALPTAQTCFFTLSLPTYTSDDIMLERLRYAVNQCRGIDLDAGAAQAETIVMNVGD